MGNERGNFPSHICSKGHEVEPIILTFCVGYSTLHDVEEDERIEKKKKERKADSQRARKKKLN